MLYLIYKIIYKIADILYIKCAAYKVDLETHLELSLFFFLQLQLDCLAPSVCSLENNSNS